MFNSLETLLQTVNVQTRSEKNYELQIKKLLEDYAYTIVRGDHKNYMPDWLAIDYNGVATFIECKNYRGSRTEKEAWRKCQTTERRKYQKSKERRSVEDAGIVLYCVSYNGEETFVKRGLK